MSKSFLGSGWSFPVDVDSDSGQIKIAKLEESVRQCIWNILGTAPGERVMRPDFGCGIHDLVFELNSASTAGQVSTEIQDALLLHEPRIDVLSVEVNPDPRGEVLIVNIDYRVRATNNVFNLVYPFYLERSAG